MTKQRLAPLAPGAAMRWDIVSAALPHDPGEMVEIGCGQGAFAARLSASARSFLALEPDRTSFEIARNKLEGPAKILNCRLDELPPHRAFDTICAFEVIEHIEDDDAALKGWLARLRPGGTFIVSAPAHAKRMGAWDELVGHYRRYDPDQMRALLSDAGLEQVRVELYGYPAGAALEFARNCIAKLRLRRSRSSATEAAERTASSGRQLQPKPGLGGLIATAMIYPLIMLQRAFPNRGIALVATGRMPA